MDEGSDNESQESTTKMKLLRSTRNCNDAVIKFVGSSTNQELQAYYEHLTTVSEILIREQHQRSVHQNSDNFFKPTLLHSKTSTSSESSIWINVCIVPFYQFLNKGSILPFLFILISLNLEHRHLISRRSLPISLNFPFIGVLCFCDLELPFSLLIWIIT